MRVLAVSSSRVGNGEYLAAVAPMLKLFLGDVPLRLAFVPFAAVGGDYESYVAKVRKGLSALPHEVVLVPPENGADVLTNCDAIVVGGGNTFKLLHDLYQHDLFSLIQQKVKSGTPYAGWSAGANLAGKSIGTTNDMPVIQPQSFAAFGFLPFQINPHYYNVVIEGFHGETRDQRLQEFLLLNPDTPIIGLPEGTALVLEEQQLRLLGETTAVLFQCEEGQIEKHEITSGSDLSFLLKG